MYLQNFNEFVSLYGGNTNSATGCEYTRFYFDISETHLLSALVPFSISFDGFWIKKDAITRERKIVQKGI